MCKIYLFYDFGLSFKTMDENERPLNVFSRWTNWIHWQKQVKNDWISILKLKFKWKSNDSEVNSLSNLSIWKDYKKHIY